eukprot:TRINITY_DN12929_c0_g3_i1.p1 TRINITY_DN12929_c0_g3~~TRINITY_DN12929_c0_g3_i1.p1  ORF type:complete len:252 (-),score=90.92 TRINITY_DN12929_c0_g3_i1:69-824(-)
MVEQKASCHCVKKVMRGPSSTHGEKVGALEPEMKEMPSMSEEGIQVDLGAPHGGTKGILPLREKSDEGRLRVDVTTHVGEREREEEEAPIALSMKSPTALGGGGGGGGGAGKSSGMHSVSLSPRRMPKQLPGFSFEEHLGIIEDERMRQLCEMWASRLAIDVPKTPNVDRMCRIVIRTDGVQGYDAHAITRDLFSVYVFSDDGPEFNPQVGERDDGHFQFRFLPTERKCYRLDLRIGGFVIGEENLPIVVV